METPLTFPADQLDLLDQNDHFSKCPDDLKLGIISFLSNPRDLCSLGQVSTLWNSFLREDRIWKLMFFEDFMWWNKGGKPQLMNDKHEMTWKDIYVEYYTRGWQFDSNKVSDSIVLSNNNFSSNLKSGFTAYHGVRASRGEERGRHYFEIIIESSPNSQRFDNGNTIYMGVGVANEKFDPNNCCSGWTRENSGVGYYNDGQIFAFSDRYFGRNNRICYRSNDRVGVEIDMEEKYVIFYLNGSPVTEKIRGISGKIYPCVILANDIKHTITISTGKKGLTNKPPQQQYEQALTMLESMGFADREICSSLLKRFNGDVESVVNELLA